MVLYLNTPIHTGNLYLTNIEEDLHKESVIKNIQFPAVIKGKLN